MSVPAEKLPAKTPAPGAGMPMAASQVGQVPMEVVPPAPMDEERPIVERFKKLSRQQQIQLIIGIAATLAIILAVFMWSSQPDYKLLYGNLDEKASGEIVQILQQENIRYQLDTNTGEVLVASDMVHDVRMKLAAQGLPKTSGTGFEMLDDKQGFGTSQFMEKARYNRALEGELARTITGMAGIESARVHLAIPKQSVFIRERQEPSASVMVNLKRGLGIDEGQVAAIVHLVSSSIPNLKPEFVTVVDQKGQMLTKKQLSGDMALSSAQFEYKRKLESNYIERIERILMPIVGFEGVRAQVDVDVDFSIIESTAETYNPDLPAVRSEQTVDEESRGGDVGGIPGALTNQPPGAAIAPETLPADGTGASSAPTKKSKRATFNYEIDKTISHTRRAPGDLKRLSVAVVVDDKTIINSDSTVTRQAYTPEEVERITGLVKEAVGFSISRGDSLNVINASFQGAQPLPDAPSGPIWEQPWAIDLMKQGMGVLVVLLIILLVIRPVIRALTHVEPEPEAGVEGEAGAEGAEGEELTGLAASRPGGLSLEDWDALGVSHEEYKQMLELLRKMVKEDPRIVAQVVKTWLALDEDGDERKH